MEWFRWSESCVDGGGVMVTLHILYYRENSRTAYDNFVRPHYNLTYLDTGVTFSHLIDGFRI
jgi:hypothetical protein